MLLCMFGLFFSGQKKLKICNIKKNNFRWTKFKLKTKIIQIESKINSTT